MSFWRERVRCLAGVSALLLASAVWPVAMAEDEQQVKREVVFLVDVSGSMPKRLGGGRFADFTEVVEAARSKASAMLEPFEGDETVTVSFYRFGDIRADGNGGWKPDLREVAAGLSVGDAIAGLDEYFPAEPSEYGDNWTYVAASVYDIAYERLDMGDPCDTIRPSESRPHLLIFALTDQGEDGGGESSPSCRQDPDRCTWMAENERRKAWLQRQQLSNALSYTHWDMGNDNIQLIPPDEAVYRVRWVSKQKGQFNLSDPELDPNWVLDDFEPRIRLIPEATRPSAAFVSENPELICEARRVDALRASDALRTAVDLQPSWNGARGAIARDPLDDLDLTTSPRGLRKLGRAVELDVLRGDLEGHLTLPIPVNEPLSEGEHALRLTKESLCEALTDAYPNSTFILPPDLEGIQPALGEDCELPPKLGPYQLARIGSVSLIRRERLPTYTFDLTSDGAPANAPVSFDIDRWWRAVPDQITADRRQERRVRLSYQDADGQPDYRARYALYLQQDGEPVDRFFDDVLSFGDDRTVLEDVPADEPVTIFLPGKRQRWWTRGGDFTTGGHPGSYQAVLCVQPDVSVSDLYKVEVRCDEKSCIGGDEAFTRDGNEICVPFAVQVGPRPFFSWSRIIVGLFILAVSAYVWLRWHFRKRFAPGLAVGGPHPCLLHDEEERNLGRRIRAFKYALCPRPHGPFFYIDLSLGLRGEVKGLDERPTPDVPNLGICALDGTAFSIWLESTSSLRLTDGHDGDPAPFRFFLRPSGQPELQPRNPDVPIRPLDETQARFIDLGPCPSTLRYELVMKHGRVERVVWVFRCEKQDTDHCS